MRIEFKAALTKNVNPYIQLGVKENENHTLATQNEIEAIMDPLMEKFDRVINYQKSDVFGSGPYFKLSFNKGTDDNYAQLVVFLLKTIHNKRPDDYELLICNFLDQLKSKRPDDYELLMCNILDTLKTTDLNLYTKVKNIDPYLSNFHTVTCLNDNQRKSLILGSISEMTKESNYYIPADIIGEISRYTLTSKQHKTFVTKDVVSKNTTKSVQIFQDKNSHCKNNGNSHKNIDDAHQKKNNCIIL